MRVLMALVLGRRLVVEGREHVPATGGVLVVGNHVGTVDPPLTGALLPRLDVFYMAKSEHFARRRTAWLFRAYHAFPVVRGSADRAALRRALDLLRDGHVVLVYPEGSRSPDGRLRKAQAGAGFLARHASVPVVPVAIWGSERALERGSRRVHRVDVHVTFGPPVTLPAATGYGADRDRAAAEAVMAAVAAMLPEAYRAAGSAPDAA